MTWNSMTVSQPSPRSDSAANRRTVLGVCLLLALGVFFIFGRTCGYGFSFGDNIYFSSNYHVKAGLTWKGVRWAFQTGYASNWHPLTWLSLMLDAQIFGTGPAGSHLINVILHATNSMLLFLLLKRLTGALWLSAFVAAVFAIHPLHVESVAWVSERKDVLSMFFEMLTLLLYVRYTAKPGARSYLAVAVAFGLSLLAKPMAVPFPLVLRLLDFWPLRRLDWPLKAAGSRR